MTVQTGTPDWSVPLLPKIKRLIDSDVTLAGGVATLGPYDVTGYTGILLEHLAVTGDATFGFIQVQFQDPLATIFTIPTYVINFRGDMGIKLNIPVMGPQVSLHYVGATDGHVSHCSAISHTGGGSSSYGRNATVLAQLPGTALPAGGGATIDATLIREGPATLSVGKNVSDYEGHVIATDHLGVATVIAEVDTVGRHNVSTSLWVPPYPITLAVNNIGGANDVYNCALVLGRS